VRASRSAAVSIALLLSLAACYPAVPTPTPTSAGSPTTSATPDESGTPTPTSTPEVLPAVVIVTSSALTVFGTDGSTLASVDYGMDGAAAAAEIAEALGTAAVVTPIPGEVDGPCPPATSYSFGGLEIESPGSLWSAGSYEVIVTGMTTSDGVGIETTAGQRIGVTQAAFQAAVGEFISPYEGQPERLGFDILNPEAGPYDRIGTYAEFSGGQLVYLTTPNQLGFIGSCG
jgi:hypothetical protein